MDTNLIASVTAPPLAGERASIHRQLDLGPELATSELLLVWGRLQSGRVACDQGQAAGEPLMGRHELSRIARRCEPLLSARGIDPLQAAIAAAVTCCACEHEGAMVTVRAERAPASWGAVPAAAFETFCRAAQLGQGAVSVEIDRSFFARWRGAS